MRTWEQKIIRDMMAWQRWRRTVMGCTVILTNGCFDLLHYGHIQLLQTAKLQVKGSSTLVVGVNSDTSVQQLKGDKRPIIPEKQRLALIAALEVVDYCLIFNEKRCDQLIRTIRPNFWVKGGDYTLDTLDAGEREAAVAVKAQINIIPNEPNISTTAILQRI